MNSARYTQIYLYLFAAAVIGTLVLRLISASIPDQVLIIGLAIAVTVLGLPHGALDFAVAKSLKLFSSLWSACVFMLAYLLIAALSIVFWIQFPVAGLGLFLIISVYHFASDWRRDLPSYACLCLASIILCGPAVLHSVMLVEIFVSLLLSQQQANIIILLMQILFAVTSVIFMVFLKYWVSSEPSVKGSRWRLSEYIALSLSSLFLNPLLHFGLYFCVLHSPKHTEDVGFKLNLSVRKSILISVPFVTLTILIGLGVFHWLGSAELNTDLLRWIFIGLFGLTMSHMFLISMWHRQLAQATID